MAMPGMGSLCRVTRPVGICAVTLSCALAPLLGGCTVTDKIYLQGLETTTPVAQPPLHLNAGDTDTWVHLSPRITVGTETELTGDIQGSGPYKTSDRNLRWLMPSSGFALDADFKVTQSFALTAGVNYSNREQEGFWGGNFGLGFLFGGETVAGRLDAGMHLQRVSYAASSVVVRTIDSWFSTTPSTDVGFFLDDGSSLATAFYGSLTLNTHAADSWINGYAQFAVGGQKLADFEPRNQYFIGPYVEYVRTDQRVQTSSTYLMLSPGLYFDVSESVRLLTGVRMVWQLEVADPDPGWLLLPMAQCELSL